MLGVGTKANHVVRQSYLIGPEKLSGPGQRVKVGPQGQGGFHSEQLQPRCKSKTKKRLLMTIAAPHQLYLLIYNYTCTYTACYTAPVKNTVTAVLEYLDIGCSIRVYRSFNSYSRDPFQAGARLPLQVALDWVYMVNTFW